MNLLIDMNLSPRWAQVLEGNGSTATHWSSVGELDAPDVAIMAYVRSHDFVVLTHDLDFGAILAATQGERPSVVQIRADDVSPQAIGPVVLDALAKVRDALARGRRYMRCRRQM